MLSTPRTRSAVLSWALALLPIAACGGSAVVEKTGSPDGKDGNAPSSAAGAGVGGSAGRPAAGGSATSGGTTAGPAQGGSAATSGSNEPAQAGNACCNVAFPCDAGDQQLPGPGECPSGAECYSRPFCCNVTYCAHWTTVDAGPPEVDAGAACSLLGSWHAHSAPWNNESTDAVINFAGDGTLSGKPAFVGKWDVQGSQLTIHDTVGADMTCSYADQWVLTFSQDCQTAPLLPIGSGCTGTRRYLDWNVTLTRN